MAHRWLERVSYAGPIAAACLSLGAGPAQAAPVTLLGSYEEHVSVPCAVATSCTVPFSFLSAAIRITKVSCFLTMNTTSAVTPTKISLGVLNQARSVFTEWQYLAPAEITASGTIQDYILLADTDHVYGSGTIPAVSVAFSAKATGTFACSITAYNS